MAELLALLRLLAPALLLLPLDRAQGRGLSRATLLAGLAVALPAAGDVMRAAFGQPLHPDRAGLLRLAWTAQGLAILLALVMPAIVRAAWDTRTRAGTARLLRERTRLIEDYGDPSS